MSQRSLLVVRSSRTRAEGSGASEPRARFPHPVARSGGRAGVASAWARRTQDRTHSASIPRGRSWRGPSPPRLRTAGRRAFLVERIRPPAHAFHESLITAFSSDLGSRFMKLSVDKSQLSDWIHFFTLQCAYRVQLSSSLEVIHSSVLHHTRAAKKPLSESRSRWLSFGGGVRVDLRGLRCRMRT